MFVEYSTVVEASIPVVEKRLDRIRSDVDGEGSVVYREGEDLLAKVGPTAAVAREVRLDIGAAEIHKSGVVYPVQWAATAAEVLFPEMTADLVLTQAGRDRTRITLKGTYQPPLGPLGRIADRAVMGRVAAATVADWIDRLAAALSSDPAVS